MMTAIDSRPRTAYRTRVRDREGGPWPGTMRFEMLTRHLERRREIYSGRHRGREIRGFPSMLRKYRPGYRGSTRGRHRPVHRWSAPRASAETREAAFGRIDIPFSGAAAHHYLQSAANATGHTPGIHAQRGPSGRRGRH